MDIRDRDREREIADIIREYSKGDVDRNWLLSKNRDTDNVFKNSFNAINDYTDDFDLAPLVSRVFTVFW